MWFHQLGIVGVHLLICYILVCSNAQNINYRLSDNIKPSLYTIQIRVDLVKFEFDGSVSIELQADRETSLIEVHQLDLKIDFDSDVRVYDENLIRINHTKIDYIKESQILQIHMKNKLATKQIYVLKINFVGSITDDMKGLYRSPQYENNVVKLVSYVSCSLDPIYNSLISLRYIGTTFSAPAYARKIFPCFDEPHFKAKFHLTLTHKNNALSNMKVEQIYNETL